jgi:hypothetical protein
MRSRRKHRQRPNETSTSPKHGQTDQVTKMARSVYRDLFSEEEAAELEIAR